MGGVLVVVAVVLAVSVRFILAKEYVVGDETCILAKWSNYIGCDYDAWALHHDFAVGDTLVFNFDVGQSTVAELTKLDYDGCATAIMTRLNPIALYTKSPETITLSRKGSFYFASVDAYACYQTLTLEVNTTMEEDHVSSSSPSSHESSSSHSTMLKAVVGSVVGFVLFVAKLLLIVCYTRYRKQQRQNLNARPPNETSPVLHLDGNNRFEMSNVHGGTPVSNFAYA